MLLVKRIVLDKTKYPEWVSYAETHSALARNLYNASLFRIRQVFTGWDKETLTSLEKEVFDELVVTKNIYPSFSYHRVLSYNALEKIMRATSNPDFFAGLPMQTAQHVVKQACNDFKNWLAALKSWKKCPTNFTGKPKMPGYKKPEAKMTIPYTNQDCVIYPVIKENKGIGQEVKMPGINTRLFISNIINEDDKLKEVKLIPFYDSWILSLIIETNDVTNTEALPNIGGIDFGVRNTIALALNDSYGMICKGGALKSQIRYYCKEKARLTSLYSKQFGGFLQTKKLLCLEKHHNNFCHDFCHKVSHLVVDTCLKHKVGTIVIGQNSYWKQNSELGKNNNQMFEMIPFAKIRDMIIYKAQKVGINVVLQEESYTSKADFLSNDEIPIYGQENNIKPTFSGKRVNGLYKSATGVVLNADMNGAANIVRKYSPDAFKNIRDFNFLISPQTFSFKELNKCISVKRIAGVVDPLKLSVKNKATA